MPTIAEDRKILAELFVEEQFDAGIKLLGHEAKAVKTQGANVSGAQIRIIGNEAFILNLNIPAYSKAGNLTGYDPKRTRKLLLRKGEINAIIGGLSRKGYFVAPLKLYTKGEIIKLKIVIGRKKKLHDKREELKKKEMDMAQRRAMKGLV